MNSFIGIGSSKWWKFDFHTHTPKSDDYGRENTSFNDEPHFFVSGYICH